MIIHCNHIGEVKAVCDHFSIPINTAEVKITFPFPMELKMIGHVRLSEEELSFEQFKEKYLNQKP